MTEEERRRQQNAQNPAYDTFETIEAPHQQNTPAQNPATAAGTAANGAPAASAYGVNPLNHVDLSQQERNLRQQYDAANQQAQNQIDYATGRAVNELARTQQDAQQQFQTQYNQIDRDEARARDNQALNAAARGDRGGIGAAQYDAIANAAATNRQTVRSAQTQLATDTQRQISDLRAQGEYQKADALLSTTQQYLSQLNQLQLDAINMNLSIDQFNAQLGQWAKEYELQMQQLDLQESQFVRQLAESARQFDAAQAFNREQLAEQRRQYDTSLAYQKGRDIVNDAQWQAQMDQQIKQWADQIGLSQAQFLSQLQQWAVSRQDQLNRYAVEDARYADETAYNRSIDTRNFNYQVSRDKVSDSQWQQQFQEAIREFGMNYGLSERQLNATIDQFNKTYGLQQQQFDFTKAQTAIENTRADRQLSNQERQQAWQNNFTERQFAYGQQRDTIADNQWKLSFDATREDARTAAAQWLQQFNFTKDQTAVENARADRQINNQERQQAWQNDFSERQFAYGQQQDAIANERADRQLSNQERQQAWQNDFSERQFNFTRGQTAIENARQDRAEQTQNQYNARNSILSLISAGVPVSQDMITAAGFGGLSEDDLNLIARNNQAASTANTAAAQANADLARITANDPYGTKYTSASKSSATAAKPNMSESTLNNNLENGVNTPGIREAYQYYYGQNYYAGNPEMLSENANDLIQNFQRSINGIVSADGKRRSRGTGDASLTQYKAKLLTDAVEKGKINIDEFGYIMELFGWDQMG